MQLKMVALRLASSSKLHSLTSEFVIFEMTDGHTLCCSKVLGINNGTRCASIHCKSTIGKVTHCSWLSGVWSFHHFVNRREISASITGATKSQKSLLILESGCVDSVVPIFTRPIETFASMLAFSANNLSSGARFWRLCMDESDEGCRFSLFRLVRKTKRKNKNNFRKTDIFRGLCECARWRKGGKLSAVSRWLNFANTRALLNVE